MISNVAMEILNYLKKIKDFIMSKLSRNFVITNLIDHKLMLFVISISFFSLRNVHATVTLLTLL